MSLSKKIRSFLYSLKDLKKSDSLAIQKIRTDLLFETSTELRPGFIFKIISELEDSNFPYKVDIVNILELAASYKDDILKNRNPV